MRGVLMSVLGALAFVPVCSPGIGIGAALADEAYVCDGGRVAYVRFGELEAMKRKDPCVAAHYGAVPDAAEPGGEDGAPSGDRRSADARGASDDGSRVVPVNTGAPRPPATTLSKAEPRRATPPQARAAPEPRRTAGFAAAGGGTIGRVIERQPAPPPVAHPDTDFRNVRVLNAAPGDSAVFRHLR